MTAPISEFANVALFGSCLARSYAPGMFRLLATYRSLSASEAASRLNLHIQTAQTFLETLAALGVLDKLESTDKTRPYFRYVLKVTRISLEVDFSTMAQPRHADSLSRRLRERRSSGVRFVTPKGRTAVSTVIVWVGTGRAREERRLNLTRAQGAFLFHLPLPGQEPRAIADILQDAALDESVSREVFDLLDRLEEFGAIESPA